MCLAQGPQRSEASEARTRGPLISSQALYQGATALPIYRPAHEILVPIPYTQKPPLKDHADLSSMVRGLNFGLSLHQHSYFMYVSSEGYDESVHMYKLAGVFAAR